MQRVAQILESDSRPRLVVVLSACRGVTDDLLALIEGPVTFGTDTFDIEALRARHVDIASTLLDQAAADEYAAELDRDLLDIAGIMQTVRLIRAASAPVRDLVAGFGEIWSTRLFSATSRVAAGGVRCIGSIRATSCRSNGRLSAPACAGTNRARTPHASSRMTRR